MNNIDIVDILTWIMIFANTVLNVYSNNIVAALAWLVVMCCMIRIHLYQIEQFKKVKKLR